MGIHKWERKYQAARRRVEKSTISKRNKELILSFVNDLMLEGISRPRLVKYLSTLRLVAEGLGKQFDSVTTEDLKQYVATVQQRDISPWTKHSYKVVIRRFYKWVEATFEYPANRTKSKSLYFSFNSDLRHIRKEY